MAALLLTPAVRAFGAKGFWHALIAGILGAGAAAIGTSWVNTLALCAAAIGCALLTTVDLAVHRLPRAILVPTYATVIPLLVATAAHEGAWDALLRACLAALALGAFYFLLGALAPSGIGFGDVTFAPLLGLVLGWFGWAQVLAATLATFICAGVAAVALLITRRATARTRIAFGPWLVFGAASVLWML